MPRSTEYVRGNEYIVEETASYSRWCQVALLAREEDLRKSNALHRRVLGDITVGGSEDAKPLKTHPSSTISPSCTQQCSCQWSKAWCLHWHNVQLDHVKPTLTQKQS